MGKGVGTELSKLIPLWAFSGKCNCKNKAAEYDAKGVDWCEKNSEQIVADLLKKHEHLMPIFRLVPRSGRQAVAKLLVSTAIKNAKD